MLAGLTVAVLMLGPAEQSADTDQQKSIVARVIENARVYDGRLPNFVCTQVTRRSEDKSGAGTRWKDNDNYEDELTYFERKEHYRLVKVNGKPAKMTHDQIRGYRSEGSFGALLSWVFRPEAHTEFAWERQDTLRGRPMSVIRYRVPLEHSHWRASVRGRTVTKAFHGFIWSDAESGAVMRIQAEPEGAGDESAWINNSSLDVQYGWAAIAGEQYLLPLMAEARTADKKRLLRNITEYSGFHKYTAEASVKFEEEKK